MATISFGCDHAGFELKQHLIAYVEAAGHHVIDLGTHSTDSVDYPEFCSAAGQSVRDGEADVGDAAAAVDQSVRHRVHFLEHKEIHLWYVDVEGATSDRLAHGMCGRR